MLLLVSYRQVAQHERILKRIILSELPKKLTDSSGYGRRSLLLGISLKRSQILFPCFFMFNICNKTAGYHRHIFCLPNFRKTAFQKVESDVFDKYFFCRKFLKFKSFLIFFAKKHFRWEKDNFSGKNFILYELYNKFANFTDFGKKSRFVKKPSFSQKKYDFPTYLRDLNFQSHSTVNFPS